jgi:Kef-type K+ transport system membrane component KefB
MRQWKRFLAYFLAVTVVGLAILGLIRLGSTLPGSGTASAHVAAPTSMLEGFAANLQDPLSHLLVQLLTIIVAARVAGSIFTRFGLPAVVGEMTAGIALGPSLFGALFPAAAAFVFPAESLGTLKLLSQIGICLFMFAVGMELNLAHVRDRAREAVAVSHASILAPFLLGVVLAYFTFSDLAGPNATFTGFALFMGISMSITAFPVLARILQERGLSRTFLGSTAITCAAVDDVTAWSIMAFVVGIVKSTSMAGAVLTLALAVVFIAVMLFGVRRWLPRWLGQERLLSDEVSGGTLAIVVGMVLAAALSTEIIGIHALFGAFLAGVVMPDTQGFRERINARVEKFSSVLLLPLFFAFTGLRTQVGLLDGMQDWLLCLLIIAVATTGKLGASALAARISGMSWRDSLQLGALMNTRGLMELIVLNIGYDLGILSPRIFTMLVIMALVTTVLTGPLLSLFGQREPRATAAHLTR